MKKKILNCRALIVHPEPNKPLVRALGDLLTSGGCGVTVSGDTELAVSAPNMHQYHLIIVSDQLRVVSLSGLLKRLREGMMTAGLPVVVMSGAEGCGDEAQLKAAGADAVTPESAGPAEICALALALVQRVRQNRLDPVTGLVAGPYLDSVLDRLCSKNSFTWYFLLVKLLSLKAINYHYGYDVGDELLAKLAESIEEEVHAQGTETDFVGRLYGTRLCVVSRTRNVDSLCRNVINKSGRAFRRFYTPFEWMKGYITVESGKNAGNYHLCDVVVAALQIPPNWDNNRAYMIDVADEVLMQIPKSKGKYLIVNP